jgi:vacuolar-type H+-ATPase subunit H
MNTTGMIGRLAATITQVGAIVAAISAWLVKNLRWATGIVDKVDKARGEADTLLREARAKATPEEAQLHKELVSLKQKEASARAALKEAQEKVQQAEKEKQQIEERANGKVLAEFIREKVSGSTYQGQLGIISSIRKDLHALSELLAAAKKFRENPSSSADEKAKRDQNLPRIDRIVLYVDDLDRCPEKTVVEVLQAVHLLLAFPLFIVVIGVDSRWLLRSLRHHYAALRGIEQGADLQTFDGATEFSSTPQNYLEKIIQVPFNLRRMDSGGFHRLMEDILPFKRVSEAASAHGVESHGAKEKAVPQPASDEMKVESDQTRADGGQTQPSVGPDEIPKGEATVEEFDLAPKALIVTQKEVEFMAELVSLIPTPRAAKRLGNIYRLIRAGISPPDRLAMQCH